MIKDETGLVVSLPEECLRPLDGFSYNPDTNLQQFDKLAWYDVCRRVSPELTLAQFEELWVEFCRLKAQKAKQ
jgi:hypothetical protein